MNPIERAVRGLDGWQQRRRLPAFVFAVIKKFGDDEGGHLVALLTYFAFLATFPLLLALVGILGIVLRGHPALEQRIVNSAFSEFPIIGPELRSQLGLASLHHSAPALLIGLTGAVVGGRGLANVLQHTLNTLWQVPKVDWPGFAPRYSRTFALLGLLAVGAVLTAAAATTAASASVLGVSGPFLHIIAIALSAVVDSALFLAVFRLATAKAVPTRDLVRGAVASGIAWQVLLVVAGLVVAHSLRHAQAIAGLFGLVLGLLAWFALQATVTVYLVQVDVVRARHLWPRSITQPPLTSGDKSYLSAVAAMQTRRPEQRVTVSFTAEADRAPDPGPTPATSGRDLSGAAGSSSGNVGAGGVGADARGGRRREHGDQKGREQATDERGHDEQPDVGQRGPAVEEGGTE